MRNVIFNHLTLVLHHEIVLALRIQRSKTNLKIYEITSFSHYKEQITNFCPDSGLTVQKPNMLSCRLGGNYYAQTVQE